MRLAVFITIVGCLLAATPVAVSFWSFRPHRIERIAFDSTLWKDARYSSGDSRQQMVDNLLARKLLQGLSRQQVRDLLGKPEASSPFDDPRAMVYRTGPDRGMGIDSEWLIIEFGEQGRATEASLGED